MSRLTNARNGSSLLVSMFMKLDHFCPAQAYHQVAAQSPVSDRDKSKLAFPIPQLPVRAIHLTKTTGTFEHCKNVGTPI